MEEKGLRPKNMSESLTRRTILHTQGVSNHLVIHFSDDDVRLRHGRGHDLILLR